MFNLLIKKSIFASLALPLLIGCCKTQEINVQNDYSLSNFTMNQIDKYGKPSFELISSKASIDPISSIINAEYVKITLFNSNLFSALSSDLCKIDKQNNIIELKKNISITGFKNKDSFLKTENILWDIDNSLIHFNGGIEIKYLSTYLISEEAYYNQNTQKLYLE